MKRKTLDYLFAAGGALIAVLLLVVGFVLAEQAQWGKNYARDQLAAQKITFAPEQALSEEDTTWKPGSSCLLEYAGQPLVTGQQAECYANYYIAMHMDGAATRAGWPGETYATMGAIQRQLRSELAAAQEAGDTARTAELQAELDAATSLRDTFYKGETLRAILLTTYGFGVIADRAELAAYALYAFGGTLLLLSVAGFVHAIRTPEDRLVGAPQAAPPAAARHPQPA